MERNVFRFRAIRLRRIVIFPIFRTACDPDSIKSVSVRSPRSSRDPKPLLSYLQYLVFTFFHDGNTPFFGSTWSDNLGLVSFGVYREARKSGASPLSITSASRTDSRLAIISLFHQELQRWKECQHESPLTFSNLRNSKLFHRSIDRAELRSLAKFYAPTKTIGHRSPFFIHTP